MFDTITKWLAKMAEKVTADQMGYALLGLLGFVFLVSFIAALGNKERRKFKKGVRILVQSGGNNTDGAMKAMPQAVSRAYNRAETLGGNPADFMTHEACVSVPFRVSVMSKLTLVNFCSTVFIALLAQFLMAYYSVTGTVNAPLLVLVCGGVLTVVSAIISAASYRASVRRYNDFVAVLGRAYNDRKAASAPAPASALAPVEQRTESPVCQPAPAVPAAYPDSRPVVPEEDVVARIDRISREGAPLSVMREVALLLQQERAKPENKTPEQQRRLNEALSKLLKAMSVNRG